jgi:surface protein
MYFDIWQLRGTEAVYLLEDAEELNTCPPNFPVVRKYPIPDQTIGAYTFTAVKNTREWHEVVAKISEGPHFNRSSHNGHAFSVQKDKEYIALIEVSDNFFDGEPGIVRTTVHRYYTDGLHHDRVLYPAFLQWIQENQLSYSRQRWDVIYGPKYEPKNECYSFVSGMVEMENPPASWSLFLDFGYGFDGELHLFNGHLYWGNNARELNPPWGRFREYVEVMVFVGTLIAGRSLYGFFSDLPNLIGVRGLEDLDTHDTEVMTALFADAKNLETLNLSSLDTTNVRSMRAMFLNASALKSLDLSGFDTRNVADDGMHKMFEGATSLRELKLGKTFALRAFKDRFDNIGLPPVPDDDNYTGKWQNVGSGTVDDPQGEHVLTSAELMTNYDGKFMADTYVWQKRRKSR